MKVELIGILVALANILGAGMIVPQAIRIHRYGDFGGVSAVWIGVGIGMNLWWLGYAVQGQLWGLVPVSAAAVGLYSIIALQCLNLAGRSSWRSLALGVFGLGSLPLPFLAFGSWSSAGLVIGLCYGLQFAPALFSAFRSDRLDGISQLTWSMAFIEAAIWVVYGTSVGDQALMVGGGGGAAMAILILLRIRFVQPGTMPRFASLCLALLRFARVLGMRWETAEYEPGKWDWAAEQVEAYEASGGNEANTLRDTGMPILIMWTIGNRSGKLRKVPLMKVEHEGEYAIVASKGGDPAHPAWYHNLVADPRIRIQDGPEPRDYELREIGGEERAEWWTRAVAAYPPYQEYQDKTNREIPVLIASLTA